MVRRLTCSLWNSSKAYNSSVHRWRSSTYQEHTHLSTLMKRKFNLHFQWLNSKKPHRVIEIQNRRDHNLLKTDHNQFKPLTRWKCERYTSEETRMNFLKLQAKVICTQISQQLTFKFSCKDLFYHLVCLLVCWFYACLLIYILILVSFCHLRRRSLNCNNAPQILTYEQVCGEFLLINECCGSPQSIVGSATPGQVLLGHVVSYTSLWILQSL